MRNSASRIKHWIIQFILFLILITPSLLITYYSYTQLHEQLTEQTLSERQSLARQMAVIVESRLDAVKDVSLAAAADISQLAKEEKWDAAIKELEYISSEFAYADIIFLVDKPGTLKALYPPSPQTIGKSFTYRDWYQGVSKNWTPYASEVFVRAVTPALNTIVVAVPIKDKDGTILGVMGIATGLDSFHALSREFKVDKGGFLYIVNQKGQIVAHPKYDSEGKIVDFSSVPIVKKLLKGESGIQVGYNPIEKEERLGAYQTVPKYNWGVVIADPITTAFSKRDALLKESINTNMLFIALNAILAFFILRFISQVNNSKKALRKANERFEFTSKATNDTIYDRDLTTNSVWFSEGMQKLFGYAKNKIPFNLEWWSSKIHSEDKKRVDANINKLIESKEQSITLDYRFQKADGNYAFVLDRGFIARDRKGKAIRLIGSMQDITAQKLAEEKLQTEKIKDEAILENIGDGLIVTDEEARIMIINKSAQEMLGYTLKEVENKKLIAVVPMKDKLNNPIPEESRPMTKALITGKKIVATYFYQRPDKSTFPASVTVTPIIIGNKIVGTIEVFRDITREKEVDQMKDEFVSIASHELRTPMTAIKGLVSMIEEGDYGKISDDLKEPLGDIAVSTQRLIYLVNDLLNVSRIEAGRVKYEITTFPIHDVLKEVVNLLQPIAKEKNLTLTTEHINQTIIQADCNKLKQIMNNLLGNSLKFTDKGSITVSTKEVDDHLIIFVTDTGMGITPVDQKKLFGKFQQISSQQEGKPQGTGLGLYISQELAHKMGGDLRIEKSELGKGTTFSFSIPKADSPLAKRIRLALEKEASSHPDQKTLT